MSPARKKPTYAVPIVVTVIVIPLSIFVMAHAAWYTVLSGFVLGAGLSVTYFFAWFARYTFKLDGQIHHFLEESAVEDTSKEP